MLYNDNASHNWFFSFIEYGCSNKSDLLGMVIPLLVFYGILGVELL